jgi:hypothetical protein
MQGVDSVWETDLMQPLIDEACSITGHSYKVGDYDDRASFAMRVLAEHARSATMLVNDGVFPSNEARGYVLRRIIRRAVRFAYLLGTDKLVMPSLVAVAGQVMGDAYPDVTKNMSFITAVIGKEEARFRHPLKNGLAILDGELNDDAEKLSGSTAFLLHDTYGFPLELTQEIASERKIDVDLDEFNASMTEQRERARRDDFSAFELPQVSLNARFNVSLETIQSQNVLARLPGSTQADETLMVSSHWDAYGQGEPDAQGRTVRPGANDDALGTAGVIELARVLKAGSPLARSVVFAVWTAEESGLLGSAAYAMKPIYPLHSTVANFTLDILQTAGPARDVILVGEGQSDLEYDLVRAAAKQSRVVTPENLPENGLFFRADHFSLARQGVPVLLLMGIAGGADLIEGGRAAGDQWIADYTGNCYHQTCDAWSADWDLRGAVEDIELFHTILRDLGNSARWPQLNTGSEFSAIRAETHHLRATPAVN